MVYDDLLGEYLDDNNNVVVGVPEVEVEKGKSYSKEFDGNMMGADIVMAEAQEKAVAFENAIKSLKTQLKTLENQQSANNEKLLAAMRQNNLWKIQIGNVTITRKAESERHTIDSKRLKEEMPEVAKLYENVSKVKESILIKIGGTEND